MVPTAVALIDRSESTNTRRRSVSTPQRRLFLPTLVAALLLMVGTLPAIASAFATDLRGNPIKQLAPAGSKAVVLFFTASDCPIASRYIPEIQRLAKEFALAGVTVWFVYPNPGDTAHVVQAHHADYAITTQTALDTNQALMKLAHASVTPEAAILIPAGNGWREVYRGRIDDRYISLGDQRPTATHRDLEDGIRAVLKNQPVKQPGGPSVGCSIVPLQP